MPFCYAPWANLDIGPQGNISPCCKFQIQHYDQQYNIQQDSLEDYLSSKFLADVKDDLNKNIWPIGCQRCEIEEQNKILSMRQLNNQRWQNNYQDTWVTASIAFGNTCNLKCISCGPYSSSKWHEEYKKIYSIDIKPVKFYKKDFVTTLVKNAPSLIHLDIPGGEPFLSGIQEQKELLSYYVQSNQSENITLHYTTNTTIYPDNEWWKLWKHFKQVEIQLSIDGVEKHNEYIRFPSNWNQTLTNVQRYLKTNQDNLQLSVSHTVSAYNIYYLDEFFSWCQSVGLPQPWLGRVHRPDYMRPTVWNELAKTDIYNKLKSSKHPDVLTWANLIINTDDSKLFTKFRETTLKHDKYRNIDFKQTFPEMAAHL